MGISEKMSFQASRATAYGAIGLIYDAAVDPARWDVALDAVSETVGARACALLVRGRDEVPYDVSALSAAYRDYVETPEAKYNLNELRPYEAPDWEAFARQPVGQPFMDEAVGITRHCLDTRPDCVALERYLGVRL